MYHPNLLVAGVRTLRGEGRDARENCCRPACFDGDRLYGAGDRPSSDLYMCDCLVIVIDIDRVVSQKNESKTRGAKKRENKRAVSIPLFSLTSQSRHGHASGAGRVSRE